MDFQIVVARYNEDINYLSYFSSLCIIYNKGTTRIPDIFKNIINLPNIGRETHTYLYHIINNYNFLSNNTLFIQGKIDDHKTFNIERYMKNKNITGLKKTISVEILKKKINHDKKYLDNLNISSMTAFQFINKILNININNKNIKNIPIIWGANFCVSKELILSKPIEYYKNLIKYVEYNINPEEGHFFERSWYILFKYPYVPKKFIYYYYINDYIDNIQFEKIIIKINNIIYNNVINKVDNIVSFDLWTRKLFDNNILKKYNLNINYLKHNQFLNIYPTINFDKENNQYSFQFNYNKKCILLLIFDKDIYELRFEKYNLEIYHHNSNITIINYNFKHIKNNINDYFLIKWNNNNLEIENLIKIPIFLNNIQIKFIKVMSNDYFFHYISPNKIINYFYTINIDEIKHFYLYNFIEYYTIPLDEKLLVL
jgi:hypothetical protein